MRPLELTVEGFRSYAERVTFDWRGRGLVGIVGPIGAGKSSILDAVAFALYGKTPTVGRDTGDLINQRADKAIVELTFEVDGETWRALRGQTRKGTAPYKLERIDKDGGAETVETSKAGMTARIEQLLGLSFDAFCRSVLLAQNQFSQFLRATTGERDKVLKGIFGLDIIDRAQAIAKIRLAEVDATLVEADRRRAEIDDARARLADAKAAEREAKAQFAALKKSAPSLRKHASAVEASRRDEQEQAAALARLETAAVKLPDADELQGCAAAIAAADKREAQAEAAVAAAEAVVATSEKALDAARARTGGRDALAEAASLAANRQAHAAVLTAARARVTAASTAVSECETLEGQRRSALEQAASASAQAQAVVAQAAKSEEAAAAVLVDAQHAEMASTLRAALVPGDPCPVCEQPVHMAPKKGRAPRSAQAQKAADAAKRGLEKARAAASEAQATHAGAERSLEAAAAALERARRDADEAAAALAEAERAGAGMDEALRALLGTGDPAAAIEERTSLLDDAERSRAEALEALSDARQTLSDARASAADDQRALSAFATALGNVAGVLAADISIDADPTSLPAARRSLAATLSKETTRTTKALEAARAATKKGQAALEEALGALGLPDIDAFDSALNAAGVAHGAAEATVTSLQERIADEASLGAAIAAATERRTILERLAEDLAPSKFLRHLLAEDRAALADLGSEHCERLTNGRYRFTDDGSFDIVDLTAAEGTRRSESLSGGETFLASLALALALAEMVARGGGRLDAFFLDEGFGSLDPEHLDLAMDGIDHLVAGSAGRLVVLVSHVPEMRQRIEDLIVLDKDPPTGNTVVRSGAAPIP